MASRVSFTSVCTSVSFLRGRHVSGRWVGTDPIRVRTFLLASCVCGVEIRPCFRSERERKRTPMRLCCPHAEGFRLLPRDRADVPFPEREAGQARTGGRKRSFAPAWPGCSYPLSSPADQEKRATPQRVGATEQKDSPLDGYELLEVPAREQILVTTKGGSGRAERLASGWV